MYSLPYYITGLSLYTIENSSKGILSKIGKIRLKISSILSSY